MIPTAIDMPHKSERFEITQEDQLIATWCIVAVSLSFIDLGIPSPLPGVKPGLANIAVLIVLNRLGLRAAVWVSLLRVLTVGLLIGTFLSPTFWLSLCGALGSLCGLILAARLPARFFSAITQSIIAALGHLAGQLAIVHFFLIPVSQLSIILPILMGVSILMGVINGMIVNSLLNRST